MRTRHTARPTKCHVHQKLPLVARILRLATLVLVCWLPAATSNAAITFGAVTDSDGVTPSSGVITFSHTVGAGSDTVLMVCAVSRDDTVSSVTYAGTSLTKAIDRYSADGLYSSLWYKVGPATGANSVVITTASTGPTYGAGVAMSLHGVHSSLVDDSDSTETTGANPSFSGLTTVTNGAAVVDCLASNNPYVPLSMNSETNRVDRANFLADGQGRAVAASTIIPKSTAGSVTMGWNVGGNNSSYVGLAVKPAIDLTSFYVDPDWSGSRDGGPSTPWTSMANAGAWDTVNEALETSDVTIYFSAREASSDTAETGSEITMERTDTSTHRLTLDGMTKWNQNDTFPSWADYDGSPNRTGSKHRVSDTAGNSWSIGWDADGIVAAMDYVTIRGFESTGAAARFRLEGGGSHFIVEYNYIHDVTRNQVSDVGGPGIQFNGGKYAYSSGPTLSNPTGVCTLRVTHLSDDVIFRYNIINNTADEGLYFGGNGEDGNGEGFDCPGHTNIQFIGNIISNPGNGSGEGDCFDLKNGNRNVSYRDNIVGPCSRNGIPIQGAAISYRPQVVVVEGNTILEATGGTGAITLINTWSTVPDTVAIRNNVVYNGAITAHDGNSNTAGDGAKYNIDIDNNTLDEGAIIVKYINTGFIRNNVVLHTSFTPVIDSSQTVSFIENYNAVYQSGGSGANNIPLQSGDLSSLFTNRAGRDYTLGASSPLRNQGVTITTFSTDKVGTSRPQGAGWDIGAYEN